MEKRISLLALTLMIIFTGFDSQAFLLGACQRGLNKLSRFASFRTDKDGTLWYLDPAIKNEINLTKLFVENPALLKLIEENPQVAPFWRILFYLKVDAHWIGEGDQALFFGHTPNSIFGVHVTTLISKNLSELVHLEVLHADEAHADYFRQSLRAASQEVKKKYPEFLVRFELKSTVPDEAAGKPSLPVTFVDIERKYGPAAAVEFVQQLVSQLLKAPMEIHTLAGNKIPFARLPDLP